MLRRSFGRMLLGALGVCALNPACGGGAAAHDTRSHREDGGRSSAATGVDAAVTPSPAPQRAFDAAGVGDAANPVQGAADAAAPASRATTVYDAANGISWLADANLAASERFGLPQCSTNAVEPCVRASGAMGYRSAVAWVAAMNAAAYLGHTTWQLPTTPQADSGCTATGPNGNSFGFDCKANALGSLYYQTLAIQAPNTAVPYPKGASSPAGPFTNLQPYLYWSSTSASGGGHSTFSFSNGYQGSNTPFNFMYVLPMFPGRLPGIPNRGGNGLEVSPDGQSVYDPVSNATWPTDANLAASNTFGLPACTDHNTPKICAATDGAMSWDSASQFVANMNSAGGSGYLGQKGWQLPPADPSCDSSFECYGPAGPLAELYYGQLGLHAGMPAVPSPDTVVGGFVHLQPYLYWSCQAPAIQAACENAGPANKFEWSFSFNDGFLGTDLLVNELFVTAYFVGR